MTNDGECPKISFVTVTFRSAASAADCLRQMVDCMREMDDAEWIFVDNCEDGSDAEYIRSLAPPANVRIVADGGNSGFATGSNDGASLARAPWVAFVNPDIVVSSASLRSVMNGVRDAGAGQHVFAVGQITHGRRHIGIALLLSIWFIDNPSDSNRELIGPSGGFAVFYRTKFLNSGGFDTEMFAWGEDVDLAMRLRAKGEHCARIETYFEHLGGHSFSGDREIRRRKVWLLARNRQIVAWRHYGLAKIVGLQAMTLAVAVLKLPYHLKHGTFLALFRGNVTGISLGVRTLAERK